MGKLGLCMADSYISQVLFTATAGYKNLLILLTDFHLDPYYKPFSSTKPKSACHRRKGSAGGFGAETSECDSPFSLVNATFKWINDNLKDSIDFVVWTGDSARHDNDEMIPRTEEEIINLNEILVTKFVEVFGKEDNINDTDPTNDYIIPIVPTYGNNDIMPHNIFTDGPNRWLKSFSHVWRSFIPEEQRHSFERGGWFFVEVIPNKLAVFSLNTLYFFDSNSAVDGCADKSEPGYEHLEWLRVQLQLIRERGMKAILMGHVPPARTKHKRSWDETCWQKYTLWLRQYRDVIVGSFYGHMNIDHFMLQDFRDLRKGTKKGRISAQGKARKDFGGNKLTVQSSSSYLTHLREDWARIPSMPSSAEGLTWFQRVLHISDFLLRKKKRKSREDKYLERIGGEWAERYSVSLVTASIVPNYFPAFRVIEYNITGLDNHHASTDRPLIYEELDIARDNDDPKPTSSKKARKHTKKKKKKKKHPKKPNFSVPLPPSKSSPPGPAYSPQLFTLTSYAQYFANLTRINKQFHKSNSPLSSFVSAHNEEGKRFETQSRRHDSGNKDHKSKHGQDVVSFTYELEYNTKDDNVYRMPDLTVRSWLNLARRIGKYRPEKDSSHLSEEQGKEQDLAVTSEDGFENNEADESEAQLMSKKGKRKEHQESKKTIEKLWFAFLRRAYVGTKDEDELHDHFE